MHLVVPLYPQGIGSRTPEDTKMPDAQVPCIKWCVLLSALCIHGCGTHKYKGRASCIAGQGPGQIGLHQPWFRRSSLSSGLCTFLTMCPYHKTFLSMYSHCMWICFFINYRHILPYQCILCFVKHAKNQEMKTN